MNEEPKLMDLSQALINLEDGSVRTLTRELLALGLEPVDILTTCEQALTAIGEKYASGEYFISGLIMAGEMMSRISEILTPRLAAPEAHVQRGRVLIGTVEGDIHDLGKNIAGALLSAHGFSVRDLGVDVPAADFLEECRRFQPHIVGLSALLTTCYPALENTVAEIKGFRAAGSRPAIVISGANINEELRQRYGADFQAGTAFDTVRICEEFVTL
jgi:Predicted cobalamin binding protein